MRLIGSFCAIALLFIGCGGGEQGDTPKLGDVQGTVTLDGAPLAGATITFQPVAGGRPSSGTTEEDGTYSLIYSHDRTGAKIGEHQVSITTFTYARPDEPEKLPEKYHSASTLTATVEATNEPINFDLESK